MFWSKHCEAEEYINADYCVPSLDKCSAQFTFDSNIGQKHTSLPILPTTSSSWHTGEFLAVKCCVNLRLEVISRTEAFEDLCTLVEHFRRSFGSVLQGKLRELHYSNPNYMSKILLDSHLKDRKPVAVNHNSVYVFKQCSLGTGYNDSVLRAANLVYSSLRFLESLRRNKLRPDIHHTIPTITNSGNFEHLISILPSFLATQGAHLFKAFPLDMSHYKCMFHSTRIPDFGIDRLETYPEARHVVVLSRGEFYTFDAFDDQNKMVSAEQLVSNFAFIRNRPRGSTEKPSVGLLTTMNRNCAALARQRLRQVDGDTEGINTRNLALIDAAIMVLIMCDAFSEYLPQLVSTTLAGPGGSRWFDKSFSLLVDRSGTAALNFDCGWTDASTALRFAESIFRDSETRPSADPWLLDSPHRFHVMIFAAKTPGSPPIKRYITNKLLERAQGPDGCPKRTCAVSLAVTGVEQTEIGVRRKRDQESDMLPGAMVRRLEWHLDEAFYEKVLLPQRDAYDALRDSLQVDCLAEMGDRTLTRRLCVRAGVCADAMMQLAFLMAHEKVHGEAGLNGGSTESHSTRTFRGGYTTLLRPFTIEMREFLRLFRLGDIVGYLDEDDLLDALHCCSRAHQKLLREAAVAQATPSQDGPDLEMESVTYP
ncbi:Carnitine O-palmitoyltransferase 2 [Echinococcus granulosus]|uniref:Carnitine O-palmitoyltransferase 2 n=1 Tax=Echinococcus granulosus TaxID=6210 RepID=W6ULE8_ECHGR|nr:Carnitine O-palmitoyltransferase 2 [Echinococcus granulosus]EUB61908.1 Carnitine O-palmitoyltransferase 2 [Echinococcus granulosus]